jgi:hypothetical protein
MSRFHVPPVPESPSVAPEPDPLLEKFRQDTIKGKKIRAKPGTAADSGTDYSSIDSIVPDLGQTSDPLGFDDTGSW